MIKMTLLIKNGKVYQNNILIKKNIFIKDNKITKITEYILNSPQGFELVDHEQEIIDGF